MPCSGLTTLDYSQSPNISVWILNKTHYGMVAEGTRGTSWSQTLSAGNRIATGQSLKVGVLDKSKPNANPNYGWLYFALDVGDFEGKQMQFYLWEQTYIQFIDEILIERDSFKAKVGWAAPSDEDNPDPDPLDEPFHYSCILDDHQDLITFEVYQTD